MKGEQSEFSERCGKLATAEADSQVDVRAA